MSSAHLPPGGRTNGRTPARTDKRRRTVKVDDAPLEAPSAMSTPFTSTSTSTISAVAPGAVDLDLDEGLQPMPALDDASPPLPAAALDAVDLPLPLVEEVPQPAPAPKPAQPPAWADMPVPAPRVEPTTPPRISVVIPTYRRPQLLMRCLWAVIGQSLPPEDYEVIVVDDGHDDATRELVDSVLLGLPPGARLRYLRPEKGRGPAVARNTGWRAARGDLVAFTDDDTLPSPTWLAEGERGLLAHTEWVAMCGRVTVPIDGAPSDHALMTAGLASAEFVTANAFVWRWALEKVNGFDEQFTRAWREDSDLQFRLIAQAGAVGRSEQAEVVHPVREAPWGLSLSQQRNTFFDALLYKKHPQLYRERIRPTPPWNYYAVVALTLLGALLAVGGAPRAALVCALAVLGLVLHVAWQRLRHTSHEPDHVVEMLATSALIPFLSVYWRLRGALHFKVLFW